ncbi:MAG: c-type cytochrome [Rhodoblastus sp.]
MIKFAVLTASVGMLTALAAAPATAAGDAAAGEKVFNKCKICHRIGPGAKNMVGPELNGIDGRKTGEAPGFNYSDANKNSGITWTEAKFKEYITDPRKVMPGTKMVFAGLPHEKDRDDLWAYLDQFKIDGSKK